MPISFSRLCLGKKATIVDEDTLPCRPREVVPVAADAVAIKIKFGLTKIGRALKQKLRLKTLVRVPPGHGPLVIASDEPFSPFARRLRSPATPSLPSLPHIPDVSSTLGRDIRSATRVALLAAACEGNAKSTNSDIYTTTPCLKRRTRSSSVLGGTDLPRPGTPLDFGGLGHHHHGIECYGLTVSVPAYLVAPIDAPLIWDDEDGSDYSSEYYEVPNVPPLGFGEDEPPSLPPLIGRAAIETAQPAPLHDWYTQQYVRGHADWSMPFFSASDPASSQNELPPRLLDLDFGRRESVPASSVYSAFSFTNRTARRIFNEDFSSPQKSELTTYSPVKLEEHAEFFPHTFDQSPPADEFAREADLHNQVEPFSIEAAELESILLSESDPTAVDEAFFHNAEAELHVTAHEAPARQLQQLFEPRSEQPVFESFAAALSRTHGQTFEVSAAPSKEQSNEIEKDGTATRTISTGTILVHLPREDTPQLLRDSLLLGQLNEYAPEAALQPGPERQVQITAFGLSRVIPGFDLFASEEQCGLIESANTSTSCSSSAAESSAEASGTHLEQINSTDPSSPVSDKVDDSFILEAYQSAVADVPTMADVLKSPKSSAASPHKKQVIFAKIRRIMTLAGTIREEFESLRHRTEPSRGRQVSTFVDLLSEMQDLKDNWYQDDQDFLHIGEHVTGYEIPQEDIDRDNATKDALTCLQTCLASAQTKLVNIASLEQALESRHQSHIDIAERVAKLTKQLSILQARENAGKVVFDQMMTDKLVEIASKESELETLRMLCNNEPVTKELAELHEAMPESRESKLEYVRLSEKSFNLLQRADERQAQAEQDAQTAKIAQTFAAMNQQSAEESHENLKERISELEAERDGTVKDRELALVKVQKLQSEHATRSLGPTQLPASTTPVGSPSATPIDSPSTTPVGSPNGFFAFREFAQAHMTEEEAWNVESEGCREVRLEQ